jgi:hypothetical protein
VRLAHTPGTNSSDKPLPGPRPPCGAPAAPAARHRNRVQEDPAVPFTSKHSI